MWILGTESPQYNPQYDPQYKTQDNPQANPQYTPQYKTLFSADGLPKAEREHLPALPELLSYLAGVREQAIEAIVHHSPQLVHWLIQHEGQHAETIAMVIAMHHQDAAAVLQRLPSQPEAQTSMVKVEGGEFWQGSDSDDAIDNEMPAQLVSVEDFWIDRCLVTCEQFAQFMAKGGYENKQWWSKEGWEWKVRSQVNQPLYWSDSYWSADLNLGQKPVCGVSWYEAAAYAASVEKRLPTESEWEKAANSYPCCDLFGSVWEWTDTWFASYAGFRPFPYPGYSQAYFDGEHRVLKGSSWASCDSIARKSFRNWYHPHRRELFAGFRCARS